MKVASHIRIALGGGGAEVGERGKWRFKILYPYVGSHVANPKSGPDYLVFLMN
jgi:hypothetical protein